MIVAILATLFLGFFFGTFAVAFFTAFLSHFPEELAKAIVREMHAAEQAVAEESKEAEEAVAQTGPQAEDCSLHWTHAQKPEPGTGGAMLGHTSNGRGYSLYSPPCNGCPIGQKEREAGIWHSGFGEERNVFYSIAPATPPLRPTPTTPPLRPVTPSADKQRFDRLQTLMLEELQLLEQNPGAEWLRDNLRTAIEAFRKIGGAGDNLKHAEERLAEIEKNPPAPGTDEPPSVPEGAMLCATASG